MESGGLCWKATYAAEIRNLARWPRGLHRSRILANAARRGTKVY